MISSLEKLFFQQNGTPSHYAFRARDHLNQFFPERFCRTVYLLMGHAVYLKVASGLKHSYKFDKNSAEIDEHFLN